ncbi:hypothetical protein GUJ93_ZPchr0002g23358 [Zizania palustris]|uniref:Uncharacterized protein n=1 Tax=Zizania palustris TaxID=103762 RepID=A0A8J5RFI3_ZIZPA|nr:hypothetical protein GUJ93_ZPchr0002g23358 [Zizania palustris]
MASLVFEPHDAAAPVGVGGGDMVFCVVILCLSALSMIIFAAASPGSGGERRRRLGRANGPVFVGGRGCACGGCSSGAGVCGTYLS